MLSTSIVRAILIAMTITITMTIINVHAITECEISSPGAIVVQGQINFTSSSSGSGMGAPPNMDEPYAIAFGSVAPFNVFITDVQNNRVLVFANAATTTSGQTPIHAFGEIAYYNNTQFYYDSNATTLTFPTGIATVALGGVQACYVADSGGNRVLRYLPCDATTTSASFVLGYSSLTAESIPHAGAHTPFALQNPEGLYADDFGNLWVCDTTNDRVLQYLNTSLNGANNPNASYFYGAYGFPNGQYGGSEVSSNYTSISPTSLWLTTENTLLVVDNFLSRVLGFNNPLNNVIFPTYTTQYPGPQFGPVAADLIIGQPLFDSSADVYPFATEIVSNQFLYGPSGITQNPNTNTLYIADKGNNRIVGISNWNNTINDPTFDILIGYGTGSVNFSYYNNPLVLPIGPNTLNFPQDMAFDDVTTQSVWVADQGNNRVLGYCVDVTNTPTNTPTHSVTGSSTDSVTQSSSNSVTNTASLSNSVTGTVSRSYSGTQTKPTVSATISGTKGGSGVIKCSRRKNCLQGALGKKCSEINGTPKLTLRDFTCNNIPATFSYTFKVPGILCSDPEKKKLEELCAAIPGAVVTCVPPKSGKASFTKRTCHRP